MTATPYRVTTETFTAEQETRQRELWDDVRSAVDRARGIAFDGCHKIYVLMDDEQMDEQKRLGYGDGTDASVLVPRAYGTPTGLMVVLREWFSRSCGLRFIQSIETNRTDPNAGFTDLIAQCEDAFIPAETEG